MGTRLDQYDITGLNSLKGKNVACVKKHITHLYLQTFPKINCYVVKTPAEGLYELVTGKVDAFVYPKQIVFYLAQSLRLRDKIKITGEPLRTLTWSMVVKEDNKEVLRLLNEGITKVRESGEYERIYNKWWGKKILAGYSKRELQVITAIATGVSVVIVLSTTLILFNLRLRRDKRILESELKSREQAEEALWEKEYIIESASSVIVTADLEGNVTYANPAFLKTWGFDDAEEFLGRPFPEFWVVEDRLDEIMEALRGKGTWFDEIQARRKDGTLFDVQVSAAMVFDREGNSVALTSSSTDITERKQAESELQQHRNHLEELITERTAELADTKEELQQIFNLSVDMICVADLKKGCFMKINPAFSRILGFSCEELLNKPILGFIHPEDKDKTSEVIDEQLLRGDLILNFENRYICKDGSYKWLSWTSHPIPEQGITFAIARDITDLKHSQEELRTIINFMSGREVRMAELKKVIEKLRAQLEEAGLTPVADDPLKEVGKENT